MLKEEHIHLKVIYILLGISNYRKSQYVIIYERNLKLAYIRSYRGLSALVNCYRIGFSNSKRSIFSPSKQVSASTLKRVPFRNVALNHLLALLFCSANLLSCSFIIHHRPNMKELRLLMDCRLERICRLLGTKTALWYAETPQLAFVN